jgi:hypothetical protein
VNEESDRPDDEATIDQLTPELALVDADLAAIARSRMPERPGLFVPVPAEPVPSGGDLRAGREPLRGIEPRPQAEPRPRTLRMAIASRRSEQPTTVVVSRERSTIAPALARTTVVAGAGASHARPSAEARDYTPALPGGSGVWLSRLRIVVAGLLLSVAVLAVTDTRLSGEQGASDRGDVLAAATPDDVPQAGVRPRTNGRPPARASSPEPPPPAAAHAAPGRPASRRRSPPPPPPLASSASSPASVFVWLPVRGASHYKVEFFRSGRKVFEATTAKARLVLPRRWTFNGRRFEVTPGNYRWLVRPGFGARSNARYGTTIVASRWAVPG